MSFTVVFSCEFIRFCTSCDWILVLIPPIFLLLTLMKCWLCCKLIILYLNHGLIPRYQSQILFLKNFKIWRKSQSQSDQLAIIVSVVSDNDKAQLLINELGPNFDMFTTAVQNCNVVPITPFWRTESKTSSTWEYYETKSRREWFYKFPLATCYRNLSRYGQGSGGYQEVEDEVVLDRKDEVFYKRPIFRVLLMLEIKEECLHFSVQ